MCVALILVGHNQHDVVALLDRYRCWVEEVVFSTVLHNRLDAHVQCLGLGWSLSSWAGNSTRTLRQPRAQE